MINEERIEEIEELVQNKLSIIDNIEDYTFKFLCIFSLLENFAQEWAGYPIDKPSEVFEDFIHKYQKTYTFLKEIDPITLFYDFENELINNFSLDYLSNGCLYTPNNLIATGESNRIREYLLSIDDSSKMLKRIEQHKYIKLLYKMRSKVSHEQCGYMWAKVSSKWNEKLPSFISVGSHNVRWELGFPYNFVKQLTEECIKNFLEDRKEGNIDPFNNNTDDRKFRLSWVDDYSRKYKKRE